MRFRVLGPVEIFDGTSWRGIGAAKWRALWALLLIDAGQVMSLDRISTELWEDAPPKTADNLVHGYVARLRGLLQDRGGKLLRTRHPGYQLVVDPDDVDVRRFDRLVGEGRAAQRQGDARQAAAQLAEALALWRGSALADVPATPWVQAEVTRLEEQRLAAIEARVDADLACGRHATLIPELHALTAQHPLREHLWGQLILALYRCDRQAEALATYQQAKQRLADELGINPSSDLQQLEMDMLRQAPELNQPDLAPHPPAVVTAPPEVAPAPAQLPPDLSTFTGRDAELAELCALPTAPDDPAQSTVVVRTIDGMAGVGKTALAIHAAHQLADRFPDGQLFIDLHGYADDGTTVDPADAVEQMLRALGVAGEHIPQHAEARVALYRTRVAGKRMLVLLDNVRHEAQVLRLLPAAPGSMVLITSRHRLAGLDDVRPISLDILPVPDAITLFSRTAGPRVQAEPAERIIELVELCGRLPLAIRIAATRLRHRPAWTVAHLIERLRDRQDRLAELNAGQLSVTAAIDLSCHYLTPEQRRMLRLLGLHPGPDVDSHAAAALADTTVRHAEGLLETLLDTHLLGQCQVGRYRSHDLIRAYAAQACATAESEPERHAALSRLLSYYLHTASTAMDVVYPHEADRRPQVPSAGAVARTFADRSQAAAWLDTEQTNLLATATQSAPHVVHLSAILHRHLRTRGCFADALTLHTKAADAARQTGDRQGELAALNGLAEIHRLQGRHGDATDCYRHAMDLARSLGDRLGELVALRGLSVVHRLQSRYGLATGCLRQALDLARDLGNRVGERSALIGLGEIHRIHGRYELAAQRFRQALEIARECGEHHGQFDALRGLGIVHRAQGVLDAAADCYEQALVIADSSGNAMAKVDALWGLGSVLGARGSYEPAADHCEEALRLAHAIGCRNGQLEALLCLGHLRRATGPPDEALRHHNRALELARELGQREDQARAHNGLAMTNDALHHYDQARHHWQRTQRILTDLGVTQSEEVDAHEVRAHLARLGDTDVTAGDGVLANT